MIVLLLLLQLRLLSAAGTCWMCVSVEPVYEASEAYRKYMCVRKDHSVGLSRRTRRLQHAQQVMQACHSTLLMLLQPSQSV